MQVSAALTLATRLLAMYAGLSAIRSAIAQPRPATASAPATMTIDEHCDQLASNDYRKREDATQRLLSLGPSIEPALLSCLARETDAEARHRLRYIIENLAAPPAGVLVVRADADSGLFSGDIITHVASRRVRNASELRERLRYQDVGAVFRATGPAGPREVGPVQLTQLDDVRDFVAPRGEKIASAVRDFATGYVERADATLRTLDDSIPEDELSRLLRAQIASCAGDDLRASALVQLEDKPARPQSRDGSIWSAASRLDLSGPGKAPFHLEWQLLSRNDAADYATENEPDLRVQRVLVPAHRFVDAFTRSAQLWSTRFRAELKEPSGAARNIAGNQLAVAGWMAHALGLRSECCRLIEPRSEILRRSDQSRRKWVRVDTDAWIPFLAGDERGAVDTFYEAALDVLQRPPQPDDSDAIIRNPQVAARIAFFLYQSPDDARVESMLEAVGIPTHPALREYVDWMLAALTERNHPLIRRHIQSLLPKLPDAEAETYARAVALLEYAREKPDLDILAAARQRLALSAASESRDRWVGIVDAIISLCAGRPREAQVALDGHADGAALRTTIEFLVSPPPSAANHPALQNLLLAVPVGARPESWIVIGRDRRMMHFDAAKGLLTPIAKPDADWFPGPTNWPWLGYNAESGRVWAYARRRVVEVTPGQQQPLRLNIRTDEIRTFNRLVSGVFPAFADAVRSAPVGGDENGEFLRSEVRAHADCVVDPDLPELGLIEPVQQDPRIVHVALRGGPHLLFDARSARVWTSLWMKEQLGLAEPPKFFACAQWPSAISGDDPSPPVLYLPSDQGLLRFFPDQQKIERLALPGESPFPKLIPENAPYLRRDPAYFYTARLPNEGGIVYRLTIASGAIEALNMVNEALPARYYDTQQRQAIRAELSRRVADFGAASLDAFIQDAVDAVSAMPPSSP